MASRRDGLMATWMGPVGPILKRLGAEICLGLFKVIFYFPNGKSTIWGIYSAYFLFFGYPLSKSKYAI